MPVRRPLRRACATASLGLAALALTGCVGMRGVTASQPGQVGDVLVSLTVCPAESPGQRPWQLRHRPGRG